MNYKLSIIIPCYNNYNFTKKCLEDLWYLPNDHEIIVYDNGSIDGTRKLESSSRTKVIHDNRNIGFALACNKAYSVSSGEHVMFLNNDIRVRDNKKGWTQDVIKESEKGAIVGPTVGVLDNYFNFVCEASKKPSKGFYYMSGWNLTALAETWDKLTLDDEEGPFNAGKFVSYFEDTDLSFRAQILEIPFSIIDVPVHHFGRMTGKKMNLPVMYARSQKIFRDIWLNNDNVYNERD